VSVGPLNYRETRLAQVDYREVVQRVTSRAVLGATPSKDAKEVRQTKQRMRKSADKS
jgi:hypothetical protein